MADRCKVWKNVAMSLKRTGNYTTAAHLRCFSTIPRPDVSTIALPESSYRPPLSDYISFLGSRTTTTTANTAVYQVNLDPASIVDSSTFAPRALACQLEQRRFGPSAKQKSAITKMLKAQKASQQAKAAEAEGGSKKGEARNARAETGNRKKYPWIGKLVAYSDVKHRL
ncbi:unnamed protein product [Amoebophrya sp. A25]|nr:unnamed protein product [Amoebophrya sp. A25]|eukprot:GSA25T00018762001.1